MIIIFASEVSLYMYNYSSHFDYASPPTLQKAENLYLLIWEKLSHTFGG